MATALREVIALFEVKVDGSALDKWTPKIESFKSTAIKAISDVRAAFKVEDFGLGGMLKELGSAGGEVGKVANTYGVELNDLQRQMFQTGLGADELGGAFRILQRNIVKAGGGADLGDVEDGLEGVIGGGKKAGEAFKKLGLDAAELGKLNAVEQFTALGDAIRQVENPTQRTALAMDVLGRQGTEFIGALTKDADALKRLGEEYDSVGGFTKENLKQFKELRAAQKSEELGWQKIKLLLAEQLLPAFTAVRKTVAWFVQGFARVTEKSNGWKIAGAAVVAILAVMNTGMIRFALSTARAALPWIALFLVVEDLYTFFTGGKSVLGDALDALGEALGIGEIGKEAQKAFASLFDFIKEHSVGELWDQFLEDAARIWQFGIPESVRNGLSLALAVLTGFSNDTLKNWGNELRQAAIDAAAQFIDGLVSGITSGLRRVVDAVKGVAGGAVDAVRGSFGLSSGESAGTIGGTAAAETLVRRSGGSVGDRNATVTNSHDITINVNGGGRGAADQVRDGLGQVLNDDRRATMAALRQGGV